MSFYARMESEVQYPDAESFWKMYETLRKGFWLDTEGYFLDEVGNRFTDYPNVEFDELIIRIPHANHRNLAHLTFFTPGARGKIIGTSCDGCFIGWITTTSQDRHFDLLEWANEELGETSPEPETEFDDFCEWQCKVENDFFENAQDIEDTTPHRSEKFMPELAYFVGGPKL